MAGPSAFDKCKSMIPDVNSAAEQAGGGEHLLMMAIGKMGAMMGGSKSLSSQAVTIVC